MPVGRDGVSPYSAMPTHRGKRGPVPQVLGTNPDSAAAKYIGGAVRGKKGRGGRVAGGLGHSSGAGGRHMGVGGDLGMDNMDGMGGMDLGSGGGRRSSNAASTYNQPPPRRHQPQPQYPPQHQQPYLENEYGEDMMDGQEDYQELPPPPPMPSGYGRAMSQNQMMMDQPMMPQHPPRPPAAVARPPPPTNMGLGYNNDDNNNNPADNGMMDEKFDEMMEEEMTDGGRGGPDNYPQQQQQQQQHMGPNGPMMDRPHCSPMCWWKGNRAWDRFKAMNKHMKLMCVWIQLAGLAHGLLSLLFAIAYNNLDYKEATNAMPLKEVAGGLAAGLVFSGMVGIVYIVLSIYALTDTSLVRPGLVAGFLCCLGMLVFSVAGPPKVLLGSVDAKDPNMNTDLLRVCAVWSFVATVVNLLTMPITWYCQQSWIRFRNAYGLPEPFIRRHVCRGYRQEQATFDNYGDPYQGTGGYQEAYEGEQGV